MILHLRELLLKVDTPAGKAGVRLRFQKGLNIIRAENSSGKSTCIQSIIYVLGLEGMLSASHDVPLPHVMTDFIELDGSEHPVLHSEVMLEIENSIGEILTLRRNVVGGERHLISVWKGAALSEPSGAYIQNDYFVRESGAAIRDAGFHYYLARFIGWKLPIVSRFDGKESLLYLECIFPLMMVEQKRGWSAIFANFPTQYRIREVEKRSVEFMLALDAFDILLRRQQTKDESKRLQSQWKEVVGECRGLASLVDARVDGIPKEPLASWPPQILPQLLVSGGDEQWAILKERVFSDRQHLKALKEREIPTVSEASSQLENDLKSAEISLANGQFSAQRILEEMESERANLYSLHSRHAAISEDLRRYRDVRRLHELGSQQQLGSSNGICPTCRQSVDNTLLPAEVQGNPMSVEDNIKFLEEQGKLVQSMTRRADEQLGLKELQLNGLRSQLSALRNRIRGLKSTLSSDGRAPSEAEIQEKIMIEQRIVEAQKGLDEFEYKMGQLADLSESWGINEARKLTFGYDALSSEDMAKLKEFERLFKDHCSNYGVSSVSPWNLSISRDTYKPSYEGFDLQFDLSASDFIRTIWAYYGSLMELGRNQSYRTNHLGLLILDEPRQQSTANDSLGKFLSDIGESGQYNQQVLFATSEERDVLEQHLGEVLHHLIDFPDDKLLDWMK